jgi:hypothetical protein
MKTLLSALKAILVAVKLVKPDALPKKGPDVKPL